MPTFNQLWTHHPMNGSTPESHPCRDSKGAVHAALDNQCAIRLGLAFHGAGIDIDRVPGDRCWNGHGRKHILRVRNLLPWIDANVAIIGCKKKAVSKNVTDANFTGKRGIVYFQNFWGRNNQGDHIDLWNGTKIAKGELDYFARSEEVWFWEM